MSALRSALAATLRGLPDAELARIVRAASDDDLRPLVQVALALGDDEEEAPAPRRPREPKPAKRAKAAGEAPRGERPTKGVQRLLDVLRSGPKSTGDIATALNITKSGVRQLARKAGKLVRSSRSGRSDAVLEAAR